MSTVIYTAWRCPFDKFEDVLAVFRKTMSSAVKEKLIEYRDCILVDEEIIGTPPTHIKGDKGRKCWERAKRIEIVLEMAREASKTKMIDPFYLDCGLNVWFYKNYAYIVPIGPSWTYHSLINDPSLACEDFCYWNNVDEPEDISSEEWNKRGDLWEEVCAKNENEKRLYHSVFSASDFSDIFCFREELGSKELREYIEHQKSV